MRAPELVGEQWLGTGGRWLTLDDLRGRVVLLDFWALCCVNCHHVLAELEPLERRFGDVLTVVGVHSPKFEHEKDGAAVAAAMQRHGIEHPVLNDPHMSTWEAYGARAWPTLILISPNGDICARYSGEGHAHALEVAIEELVSAAEADGTLVRGPGPFVAPEVTDAPYVQPGRAIALPGGRLLVSDTGRSQLAVAELDEPNVPLARIGSGERSFLDGAAENGSLREPNGLALLPRHVAERVGYDVVVADSGNHALRGVNLTNLSLRTIAGTGRQWMQGADTHGAALSVDLTTPWDVAWDGERVLVAMAGDHRLWWFDPIASEVGVWAGTTQEGLVDGPLAEAWFAQPSAIVVDEQRLWVVDAETSALRSAGDGLVRTHVGRGLFEFGHVDGHQGEALLQHPLGAAVTDDGDVLIADSYNGAVRRYGASDETMTTVARGLSEPSDIVVLPGGSEVLVVESAAGRVSRVPVGHSEAHHGEALQTRRPALRVAPGEVTIEVVFTPPAGQKQDDRYGPATRMAVSSTPAGVVEPPASETTDLVQCVVVESTASEGVLHVSARGASCDTAGEHPACHMHQQDWGIPILIDPEGTSVVRLELAG